jgi:hypothetical protein
LVDSIDELLAFLFLSFKVVAKLTDIVLFEQLFDDFFRVFVLETVLPMIEYRIKDLHLLPKHS